MRSFREIAFRVGQESANAWLLQNPPAWHAVSPQIASVLPDPAPVAEGLKGSAYAAEIEQLAEEALAHRFHLLGLPPAELGDPIRWRRDFVHGIETDTRYFRRVPYLDFASAGDHKVIWELNRHQHLVVLAQAFLLTGRREFLEEIPRQIESWLDSNPFQRGINWTSALEVAFRALSWLWVLHLVGRDLESEFRKRWLISLHQHGVHLEHNLSIYFSPNTHLLGEAVALHALGRLFPEMPRAPQWRSTGSRLVREQMERQVRSDGSHFEQSSYYHLYALDFFLLHFLLAEDTPTWYREKLIAMADFLSALAGPARLLPLLGDEDGGRLFHPYGDRRHFAAATLTTCAVALNRPEWLGKPEDACEQAAWWLGRTDSGVGGERGARYSRWFPDTGLAVMESGVAHILVRAGGLSAGSAGHSHADALSIVAYRADSELLIDPGTFTYISDPAARNRFRGTAAHNTVSIDGTDQAVSQGPFRWGSPPDVRLLHWDSNEERDVLDASCRYKGFTHRRSIIFRKPGILVVLDRVAGPPGAHVIEQRWLSRRCENGCFLKTHPEAITEPAERSSAFGSSEPAVRWVARQEGTLPAIVAAVIGFDRPRKLEAVQTSDGAIVVQYEGGAACFPENGAPEIMH